MLLPMGHTWTEPAGRRRGAAAHGAMYPSQTEQPCTLPNELARMASLLVRRVEDELRDPDLATEPRCHLETGLQELRRAIMASDADLTGKRAEVIQLALDAFTD